MKKFKYRAKKNVGETVEGVLLAESRDAAIDRINEMGLLPIDVSEEMGKEALRKSKLQLFFFKKVRAQDLAVFYGQFSKLAKAGVPILRALNIILEQTGNVYMREILENVQRNVKEGSPLSSALLNYSRVFLPFDIAMIQAGESVGKLDESLMRLVGHLEQREMLLAKVRAAIAYPLFIMTMGFVTVFVMLTFVVPKFAGFFKDLGQDLPASTKLLISVSHWCKTSWGFIAVLVVLAVWFFKARMRSKAERKNIDTFLIQVPKIGELITKFEITRVVRALELLLRSGMQLLHAMKIAIPVIGNEAIKDDFEKCYKTLEGGGNFSDGLKQSKHIPLFVYHMVSVGEQSGKLDDTLNDIGEWYEKDTTQTIQVITNLLEPMIILVVGFILGLIILAVLMPVFSMNVAGA